MKPLIVGITRVRNEAHMIADTLDHFGEICTGGIYVLDEDSQDDTADICGSHPAVEAIIIVRNFQINPGERRRFEGWGRQIPLELAKAQYNRQDLWVLCFDADERIEFDFDGFHYDTDAVSFRLFDFYITEEDEHLQWHERRWIGPEYRDIPMLFRVRAIDQFRERCPILVAGSRTHVAGYSGVVRHYGKAISEEEWEATCHYYSTYQPEPFKSRWEDRKGKCVRRGKPYMSDFGHILCPWEHRSEYGMLMEVNLSLAEDPLYRVLSS